MFSSSKHLVTWANASHSLIFAKNLLPKPSPFEAPFTKPAISINVILVGIVSLDTEIFESSKSLWSGTVTSPIFGSIVQNGKFAACALLDLVKALNKVDFPTFGRPIIPVLKPILFIPLSS